VPIPFDYDHNPDRFRTGKQATRQYGVAGDIYEPITERLVAEGLRPVLDVGCGDGSLAGPLRAAGVP
jgi:2-polyprenyl-3-methyl-5-hydroxy-6-metoxy-1,4-benzoquinol methylase